MRTMLLAAALLTLVGPAGAQPTGYSWLRDYRDIGAVIERAHAAGSGHGMRRIELETRTLVNRVRSEVPEAAARFCIGPANAMANVALSLSQGNLVAAERDRRQWKEWSPRCERAITTGR